MKTPTLALLVCVALAGAGCLSPSGGLGAAAVELGLPPGIPAIAVFDQAGALPGVPPHLGGVPQVVGRLTGHVGAEPNVGVTSSGAVFVSAFDTTLRSRDGGNSWDVVHDFNLADVKSSSDPMLWVDPDTDRIFVPHMFPILACSSAVYSDDDGDTWTEKPMSCGIPGVDHQKLATGKWRDPVPGTPLYENAVYYCYNKIVSTNCALSFDGGLTFPVDRVVATDCGGINGHPTAAPDGTLYVPFGFVCGEARVAVSTDNGLTYTVRELGVANLEIDPEVAVTPDGTAYYMGLGDDNRAYLVRSTDQFATVEGPFEIVPADVLSVRFAGLVAGSDGRLAAAYLGTRDSDEPGDLVPDDARWHLFVSYVVDADTVNPLVTTVQVTPDGDPVQIGYIWKGGGGDPGRNLLDFIDMVVDREGRIYVAYTDGCTTDCADDPEATLDESRSRDAALAILEQGPSLFEGLPALAPVPDPEEGA